MRHLRSTRVLIAAAMFAAGACTVHQTEAPNPTGPSTFGLAVTVTATPDAINRDGASQSAITVTVRNSNGQPVGGQALRLDMEVAGSIQDFGTLSARSIVTGSDGVARAIFTAPAAPPSGVAPSTSTVSIVATASGTNAQATNPQTVDIRLTPIGVILPSGPLPTPKFTFAPASPAAGQAVSFDGSTSCPGPLSAANTCPLVGTIVTYQWNFGDGTTGSGATVSHTFPNQQTYGVTLTVTNDLGVPASVTQSVNVGAGILPTGSIAVSPTPVNVNDTVNFSAAQIKPGPGRTIAQYNWDFGDGNSGTGAQTTHAYTGVGNYTVVLTVVDDLGTIATFSTSITVGNGKPIAQFLITKVGNAVHVDGSASTAAGSATIASYVFDFGDGSSTVTTTVPAPPNHLYTITPPATSATFSITLTVTDSLGRVSVPTTQSVTIP